MQNFKTITVSEKQYTIKMFSPTRATKLFARLVKLMGAPLALMADGKGEDGKEGEMLSKALTALAINLKEDEFEALLKDLLSGALYENQPLDSIFDKHFVGGIGIAFILAGEVIKYNYKDFLSVLPGGKGLLAEVANQ